MIQVLRRDLVERHGHDRDLRGIAQVPLVDAEQEPTGLADQLRGDASVGIVQARGLHQIHRRPKITTLRAGLRLAQEHLDARARIAGDRRRLLCGERGRGGQRPLHAVVGRALGVPADVVVRAQELLVDDHRGRRARLGRRRHQAGELPLAERDALAGLRLIVELRPHAGPAGAQAPDPDPRTDRRARSRDVRGWALSSCSPGSPCPSPRTCGRGPSDVSSPRSTPRAVEARVRRMRARSPSRPWSGLESSSGDGVCSSARSSSGSSSGGTAIAGGAGEIAGHGARRCAAGWSRPAGAACPPPACR